MHRCLGRPRRRLAQLVAGHEQALALRRPCRVELELPWVGRIAPQTVGRRVLRRGARRRLLDATAEQLRCWIVLRPAGRRLRRRIAVPDLALAQEIGVGRELAIGAARCLRVLGLGAGFLAGWFD